MKPDGSYCDIIRYIIGMYENVRSLIYQPVDQYVPFNTLADEKTYISATYNIKKCK